MTTKKKKKKRKWKKENMKVNPEIFTVHKWNYVSEIPWEFFITSSTTAKITRKLYPSWCEGKKKFNHSTVKLYFNFWYEKYLVESIELQKIKLKSKNSFEKQVPHYILNMKFFFDEAKKKKVKFDPMQKNILEFLFYDTLVRKHLSEIFLVRKKDGKKFKKIHVESLFDAILKYYFSVYMYWATFPKAYSNNLDVLNVLENKFKPSYELENLRQRFVPYPDEIEELREDYSKGPYQEISKKMWKKYEETKLEKEKNPESKNIKISGIFKKKTKIVLTDYLFYYLDFHKIYPKEMQDLDMKILELLNLKPKFVFSDDKKI